MDYDELLKNILKKITPTPQEQEKIENLSKELEQKIKVACQAEGIDAIVRVEGSVAKGTWLAKDPDIDIFIRLPTSLERQFLDEVGLRIAKRAAGDAEQLERYAEHPYLEIFLDDIRVDIVPCYDAKRGEWKSATDRTPYHTDYIKTHLDKKQLDEVRLLKRFLKGIGVYGAEIRIGGFSGYLCELLILYYGSFMKTIEAFANYDKQILIDIESQYAEQEKDLYRFFPEPLVIVDPIDKGRNVASPVQIQKLFEFIAATRAFKDEPSQDFFYPPPKHALPPNLIENHIKNQGTEHLYLSIGELTSVPDVMWGQLYRTKRSLHRLLETNGFCVLRDAVWSNEKSLSIFVFELEQSVLPNIKKHLGPQLERIKECEAFLSKYTSDRRVVSGPFVEEGRWVVEIPRKYNSASVLFEEKLKDGGKSAGVAELVAQALQKEFKVLLDEGILRLYTENSDFAVFLTDFLSGRPFWLKAKET